MGSAFRITGLFLLGRVEKLPNTEFFFTYPRFGMFPLSCSIPPRNENADILFRLFYFFWICAQTSYRSHICYLLFFCRRESDGDQGDY